MAETVNTNVRKDYKDCPDVKLGEFITAVERFGRFARKGYIPVNDSSHFERFNYAAGKYKISIVYDTKAHMLSLTAQKEIADVLDALYAGTPVPELPPEVGKAKSETQSKKLKISDKLKRMRDKTSGDNAGLSNPVRKKNAESGQKQESRVKAAAPVQAVQTGTRKHTPAASVQSTGGGKPAGNARAGAPQRNAQTRPAAQKQEPARDGFSDSVGGTAQNPLKAPEYKNGFSIKDVGRESFDAVLKNVRAVKGVTVLLNTEFKGRPSELVTVEIAAANGQKAYLRYMPHKKSLTLQGKRSALYTDIQMLLTPSADFDTAIASHIKSSGEEKTAGAAGRRLKKLVPNAFEYLSDQSKIDLTIGLIDIHNDATRLSDYSVLLVPPYRGLERLIFDLQAAEGIEVKMIGQGFEKRDDGSYCLKSGYRKKINSVVYNEVLSALYTEYFKERHNFTHSDNTEASTARVIRELTDARAKFDKLLEIIDYNCKKLKEIGFGLGSASKEMSKA